MKVVQFGLTYSPNLGDGIIADCLTYGLKARQPGTEVVQVDISARTSRGEVVIRNRELILNILDRLPMAIRHRLALWKLGAVIDKVEGDWRIAAQADLAVIGGGQIFSDANLNFPVKLSRAAGVLAEAGTPTAVYAVGVSQNWSAKGTQLFRAVLGTNLKLVGIRDEGSRVAWTDQMQGGPAAEITLDPGLLAAACYGTSDSQPKAVGLCITDFGLLAHHADSSVAGAGAGAVGFYVDIAASLAVLGHRTTLFCNGAAEDLALMQKVAAAPKLATLLASRQVTIAPNAKTPTALARQISEFEAVIAHRLHACIVAYSYGRPVVGLGWDQKLEAFFDMIGSQGFFSSDAALDGQTVAKLAVDALHQGLDPDLHQMTLEKAWGGIDRLLACAVNPTA